MSVEQQSQKRPPEQVAIGYIKEAESYRQAALRVYPQGSPAGDVSLLAPAWHLLCHSAELALKAFLLSHGVPEGWEEGELKHPAIRHQLLRLHEAAVSHGFKAPDDDFGDLMEWLAPFHSSHAFRYRSHGFIRLATPPYIAEILEPVIARISQTVRKQWMATQSPGHSDESLASVGLARAQPEATNTPPDGDPTLRKPR